MAVEVRLGRPGKSRLPSQYTSGRTSRDDWASGRLCATRVASVTANLRDPASWFLLAYEESQAVAMAAVLPFRADRGAGPLVPETHSWI